MHTQTWRVAENSKRILVLGLMLVCGSLVACGSTSTPAATASPSATSTAIQAETCQTSQLALAKVQSGAGLGHVGVLLGLENSSQRACALEGYPGLQLLDASQHPLPTHVQQTTMAYTFHVPDPQRLVLAPATSAYVHIEWSDMAPSGQGCSHNAAFLQVTPPQTQSPLVIALDIGACDGALISSPLEPAGL